MPPHSHDDLITDHIGQLAKLTASCDQNKGNVGECKEGLKAMGDRITKIEHDVMKINTKLALWTSAAVFVSQGIIAIFQKFV